MSLDVPLKAFSLVLIEDLAELPPRGARRARWDAAWQKHQVEWRESFGYKHGPIMDHHMVKREAREMVALVMKARLMMMVAPLFVMAESIDRSLHILSIFASPSGNGPERYAPTPGVKERISVR